MEPPPGRSPFAFSFFSRPSAAGGSLGTFFFSFFGGSLSSTSSSSSSSSSSESSAGSAQRGHDGVGDGTVSPGAGPHSPQFFRQGPSPPQAPAAVGTVPAVGGGGGARTATPPPRGCGPGAHTRDAGARVGLGIWGPRPPPRAFSGFWGQKAPQGRAEPLQTHPMGGGDGCCPPCPPPLTLRLLWDLGHAGAGCRALLLLSGLPSGFGAAVLVTLLFPFLLLLLPQLLHPWAFQATP